ncbi:MAG: hypothetical protein U0517_03265 [Candidatus Andersenbacteria bacterium]
MRNRAKKRHKKANPQGHNDLGIAGSPVDDKLITGGINETEYSVVKISSDEARMLSFIRRDVLWAVSVLTLIVVGFVVLNARFGDSAEWNSLAERFAKLSGLVK